MVGKAHPKILIKADNVSLISIIAALDGELDLEVKGSVAQVREKVTCAFEAAVLKQLL